MNLAPSHHSIHSIIQAYTVAYCGPIFFFSALHFCPGRPFQARPVYEDLPIGQEPPPNCVAPPAPDWEKTATVAQLKLTSAAILYLQNTLPH